MLAGCSARQKPAIAQPHLVTLPAQLSETSGLLCLDHDFISFNDSGGEAVLYRFDVTGQITSQLQLAVKNSDWEAISSDGQFLYLGDTGNNAGKKQLLSIYKVPLNWSGLTQPYQPERLEIQLPVSDTRQPHQHDFDFEALVYQQHSLWLISKSWASQTPVRYKLDPDLTTQELGQAIPFADPGFLVTDAVFDPDKQQWWLVGYPDPRKAIWAYLSGAGFQPQISRYDKNWLLLETKNLPSTGQVEGLCIDGKKQIWITEEGSKHKPALLIKTQ